MPTAFGMEARAMPHNIMPVTHILSTKQGSLLSNLQTYPQNGVTVNTENVSTCDACPTHVGCVLDRTH
jgi:hypothetical protein